MSIEATPHPDSAAPANSSAKRTVPRRSLWPWLLLAVAVLAGGGVWWKLHSSPAASTEAAPGAAKPAGSDRPVPVAVEEVQQRTMPIYFTGIGIVSAYNTVSLKSRVDGQITKVNFTEGQQVKQGQLLVQIDPEPYEAALAQAEGQYARDEATANNNKAQAARYASLLEAGVVSKETEALQSTAYGQAVGALKADQAAIQAAKVNLAYTHIKSPINGMVGLRQVDVGNIVHAADTTSLVVVTQLEPISVIFTLPEDQLPAVRKHLRSKRPLQVDAFDRSADTMLGTGTLLTVDNQIDATTGTDKLKATFPNKDGALFPNQFVNVKLILEQRPDAIVVPSSALQTGSIGTFVYVMAKGDDGTPIVKVRPVVTTITEGAQTIIDSGLKPGEKVVTDGQEKLKNGSKIALRKPGAGGKGESKGKGAAGKSDAEVKDPAAAKPGAPKGSSTVQP